ncbi:S-layer homology domain-containing protein [Paenibacillus tyrfis]|uniref:Intimin n=1 Tax=Paenibacillus tyrfis TaxID=1501230 RepID=A0A081P852_9BACL|nr:S-layer homology domain-containing protein [Paenibacillus tyrfis]KEQ26875.1 lectin [Paenibacillus tyrfis]
MKVHRSKWMSWLLMISMVVTLLQPALQAHAAEDSVKWVTYKNDDFSNEKQLALFSLNGSAKVETDNKDRKVLRLTEALTNKFGTAFNKKLIAPGDNYSFSTFFKFRLNENKLGNPADGITFTIQAESNTAGSVGVGIGYGGIKPSFAVKYDTYKNADMSDPSNNYIGLAVNGDVKNSTPGWFTAANELNSQGINLSSGTDYYSWIDYDGSANNVKVYISSTEARPTTPVLNANNIDLANIFKGKPGVYAGFTAATGGAFERHDIISWYFTNELAPIDTTKYQYKQAPTNVTVNAVPTGQPGQFQVIATLYDVDGNPVSNAPISFASTQGTLTNKDAVSDGSGRGTTVLDFGSNPPSGEVTAKVMVGGAYATVAIPPSPTNLKAGTTPETANKLTWNTVTGATYYNLYKDGALYATNVSSATYQVTDLAPGEFATFTVTAVVKGENGVMESAPSNSVTLPTSGVLTLDSTRYTLPVGSTHQTVVSSVYSNGTKVEVTNQSAFSSANNNVVTISPSGLVTAVGAGTTVIYAVYNGTTLQASITVSIAAPTGVTTDNVTSTSATVSWNAVPGAQSYNIYDNGKLIASGVTDTRYTVTGLKPGTNHNFTVSAVSNGIESPASGATGATTTTLRDLVVTPANYTLVPGATHQTQATAVYLDESIKDVTKQATYVSSNPDIVSVDANGVITAKAPGTAVITVTYDGKTATETIVVQEQVPPFNLTLNKTPNSVPGDGSSKVTLSAGVVSADGNPVAGVPVTFHFGNTKNDVTAITNEQGIASIEYTAPVLQGLAPLNEVITVSGLSKQQSVEVTYMPAAVRGIVIDQVTGKPAAGATVSISADFNGDGIVDFISTVTTAQDGSYQIGVPRGNFAYTMNIQTPVQLGNRTVTLNSTQTAVVGQLNAAGQKIDSANKISGQLFIAPSASNVQQTPESLFGSGNVSAVIQGINGTVFQSTLALKADGSFELEKVPGGQYKISYQIKAPNGAVLAGPSAIVNVKQNGELGVVYSLIDPYGTITDEASGKPVDGVSVKLYWADTELNKQNGRTPHTPVELPELAAFAPNKNHNPQLSDTAGQYAWMVYPNADYYIVATKAGYYDYSTLTAKPNMPAADGSDSYIKDGIIHVGQDIVAFDFKIRQIPANNTSSSTSYGGGFYYGSATSDVTLNLSVDKNLVKEGEQSTITVDYKNQSVFSIDAGVVTVTIPAGAEVIDADGGTVNGNTVTWKVGKLSAGQAGSYKLKLKWKTVAAADAEFGIQGKFTVEGNTSSSAKADSAVKIKVFSDRFGNLKHQRYILGYPDGKFHPENALTRAELAAIVARMKENAKVTDALTYNDVQESHWAANYIKIATKYGYFNGFEDGSFRPEAKVSRGELASVMARFLSLNVSTSGENHFKDVSGHWAGNAIEELYRGKFLAGYEDGTFKPADSIRRVEAVTMINRMLYRGPLKGVAPQFPDVAESHWGFGDVQEATVSHESVRNADGSEAWKSSMTDDVQ